MTAKYWTMDGVDMWRLEKREVFDFKNMDTGDVVTCECVSEVKFTPVIMPDVKRTKDKGQRTKAKKQKAATKTPRSKSGVKSKYKGVKKEGKKYSAGYWDKVNKKPVHIGMFISELLAAAAVQEARGDHKEALRLREEHQEGDGLPEVHKGIFPG